ncbi:LOW QUALITY PROTEIN: putative alanine aminotransferase [Paramyrothecium foliicola]|nr:LOW QUALITY PROTEIN: putative alanine aminotransferase [Paramyrothecium foliicola]
MGAQIAVRGRPSVHPRPSSIFMLIVVAALLPSTICPDDASTVSPLGYRMFKTGASGNHFAEHVWACGLIGCGPVELALLVAAEAADGVEHVVQHVVLSNPGVWLVKAAREEVHAIGGAERQLVIVGPYQVFALFRIEVLKRHCSGSAGGWLVGGTVAGEEVIPSIVADVVRAAGLVDSQEFNGAIAVAEGDADVVAVDGAGPVSNAVGVYLTTQHTDRGRVAVMGRRPNRAAVVVIVGRNERGANERRGPYIATPLPLSNFKMPRLNIDNVNPHVVRAKYAVRGELALKSEEYRAKLRKGEGADLPFDQVISSNIGNPQQLGQKPITFYRQVLSLLENPKLLEHEDILLNTLDYKPDVVERARWLLKQVGSVGAYSASAGNPAIKESIAKFLESMQPPRKVFLTSTRRDGHPADPAHIYLSGGASSAVNTLLHVICAGSKTGILTPIPQYPLYTAALSILDATCVPYYLNEQASWGTSLDEIKKSYEEATKLGIDVRAIVVINPGNPTGASLSEADVRSVLEFAAEKQLVVLADEVYQANVFIGEFHSFRKVLYDLRAEAPEKFEGVELASMHSTSKGLIGECGHRGGYFETIGFDPKVEEQIYKFVSITLCAPVIGQCLVELMVNPPQPGSPSYELYNEENSAIFNELKRRAYALYEAFKEMEGIECGEPQGSMYLFPTIHLPAKAAEAAAKEGRKPDEFYCLRMLDATGVCIVAGSGFGQAEGTLHFRITFLAPGTEWIESIKDFHQKFLDEFR